MSFKEKFNSKNPLNGNPPVKPLPHLETNIVTRGLMSAFYGSDAKDKMLGSANKLIDLYNKREDSNVMTEEEREYRRDLLKSISSNKRNSEGVRRSISTNLRMPDVVNEQVLVDLDKYTSEDGTQVEYVTEDGNFFIYGNIFKINENSISNKIKEEISKNKIGQITNPIQIPGGFLILKLEI